MTEADSLAGLVGAHRVGQHWRTQCPTHEDNEPSLDFRDGEKRGIVFTCRAGCESRRILWYFRTKYPEVFGNGKDADHPPVPAQRTQQKPRLVRTVRYVVKDADGWEQATHVRNDFSDGSKNMPWEHGDGIRGLPAGVSAADLPLYGSEDLSGRPDGLVIVTEGEKAAQALRDQGRLAVGTVTGASGVPGNLALEALRGRDVALWPDNDEPGRLHMKRVAAALTGVARSVSFIDWRTGVAGADAADWVPTGEDPLALLVDSLDHPVAESSTTAPAAAPRRRRLIPWAELVEKGRDLQVNYVVQDLIPDMGVVGFIAGYAKAGKTTLGIEMMSAISRGDEFLGQESSRRRVLYLSLEDPEDYTAKMASLASKGGEDAFAFCEPLTLDDEGLKWMEETISAEKIGMVYVSTFMAAASGLIDNENDNAGVARVVLSMKESARRVGIPIIVETHAGRAQDKSVSADPILAVRGASAAAAHADFVISYRMRDEGGFGTKRVVSARGRFVDFNPTTIDFDKDTHAYTVLGQEVGDEVKAADLDHLTKTGALSATEQRDASTVAKIAGWEGRKRYRRVATACGPGSGVVRTDNGQSGNRRRVYYQLAPQLDQLDWA